MKIKFAAALALVCCLLSCSSPNEKTEVRPEPSATPFDANETPIVRKTERSITEAQDDSETTVSVTGVDVEKLTVTVSTNQPGRITIPVGTVFRSENNGTQTMMAAHAKVLTFAGDTSQPFLTPKTQTIEVEVYCTNRFLNAPTSSSEFTVTNDGDELDPVRRLAECLDTHPEAPHEARQLAIWVTSDNFINLTDAEVRAKMRAHADDIIKDPNSQVWDSIRKEQHLTDEAVQEIINDPKQLEVVRESAYEEVDEEISDYKSIAGPLLEKCGFNTATSKFFQTS
jgi:hypothetical protein